MKKPTVFLAIWLITTTVQPIKAETETMLLQEVNQERVIKINAVQNQRQITTQERIEEMKIKREEFRARLAAIKDIKKRERTERIKARLNNINNRAMEHMRQVLDRLQAISDKLQDKIDTTVAARLIAEAKSAVEEQANKEYLIEFTDEVNIKTGASEAKNRLKTDIAAVRVKVMAAREGVVQTLRAAGGQAENKVETETGEQL